jgi:hypothetical protein
MIYSIPNIPMFMDRKYIIPKWYRYIIWEMMVQNHPSWAMLDHKMVQI